MTLSDKSIRQAVEDKKLIIEPFSDENVQPSSYDVTLSNRFRVFETHSQAFIDLKKNNMEDFSKLVEVDEETGLMIHPGEFLLGATVEYITMPNDLAAELDGRSTFGRLGLVIHSTAGYIDPGFEGTVTLEISNDNKIPIRLYPNIKIGQLVFSEMTTPAEFPYGHKKLGSKYQGQKDPTSSKSYKDFQ